jgi:hypothetical protein
MELNGGQFSAVKDADSRTPGGPLETCGVCHGKAGPVDVATVHGVGQFLFND